MKIFCNLVAKKTNRLLGRVKQNNGLSGFNGFFHSMKKNPINPFNPLLIYSINEYAYSLL